MQPKTKIILKIVGTVVLLAIATLFVIEVAKHGVKKTTGSGSSGSSGSNGSGGTTNPPPPSPPSGGGSNGNGGVCVMSCSCSSSQTTVVNQASERVALLIAPPGGQNKPLFGGQIFSPNTTTCVSQISFNDYIGYTLTAVLPGQKMGTPITLIPQNYPNPQALTCIQVLPTGDIILPNGGLRAYPPCST
jgi:hypothetical protein